MLDGEKTRTTPAAAQPTVPSLRPATGDDTTPSQRVPFFWHVWNEILGDLFLRLVVGRKTELPKPLHKALASDAPHTMNDMEAP
jgi:hypothetical protein